MIFLRPEKVEPLGASQPDDPGSDNLVPERQRLLQDDDQTQRLLR